MNVVRLEVGTTKNGEGRLVIPYGEMREMLLMLTDKRRLEKDDCPLVFHRDGEPIGDFRKTWTKACKAAGLWDAESKRPTKLFTISAELAVVISSAPGSRNTWRCRSAATKPTRSSAGTIS